MLSVAAMHVALGSCALASTSWEPLTRRQTARTVELVNLYDRVVPYTAALEWQRQLLSERVAARRESQPAPPDTLLLMQHPPVLTLGTASTLANLRTSSPPFDLIRTERGGEVTYHGPGQLVLYPVLDLREYREHTLHAPLALLTPLALVLPSSVLALLLRTFLPVALSPLAVSTRRLHPPASLSGSTRRTFSRPSPTAGQDVHWYMRSLEEVAIRVVHSLGLPAARVGGLTGVWVEDAKVCAIGVKLSRWVSMHGLALNVDVDLSDFRHIVPCGIADRPVTSVAAELRARKTPPRDTTERHETPLIEEVHRLLLQHFQEVFQVELREVSAPADLPAGLPTVGRSSEVQ